MKIVKPLLLVSTPLGMVTGLIEAYRMVGGLAPAQNALASYLRQGGFDRHGVLRRTFAGQQNAMLQAIQTHLPAGFTATRPAGGYFLWLECPERVGAIVR